jgi:hypothetical protein
MQRLSRIRALAFFSIGRGCFFAMLAIWSVMFGLIAWPALAFRSGGILFALAWSVLLLRGLRALKRDFRLTEVWLLLEGPIDLPRDRLQSLIGGVLRDTYLRFADFAAWLAGGLLVVAVLLRLAGFR